MKRVKEEEPVHGGLRIEVWEGAVKRVQYSFQGWEETHEPRFAKVGQPAPSGFVVISNHDMASVFPRGGTGRSSVSNLRDDEGNLDFNFVSFEDGDSVLSRPPSLGTDEIAASSDTEWVYDDNSIIRYTQSAEVLGGSGVMVGTANLVIPGTGAGEGGSIRTATVLSARTDEADSQISMYIITADGVLQDFYILEFPAQSDISVDVTIKLIQLPPA